MTIAIRQSSTWICGATNSVRRVTKGFLWGHERVLWGHESRLSNDELLSSIGEFVLSIAESDLSFDKLIAWSGTRVEGFDESLSPTELLRVKLNDLINALRR
jgi:hypothetical protein